MAKLRVTGKRFSINGMFGVTMIAIAVVAVVTLAVAAIVLPQYAQVEEHKAPEVIAIVAPDDGLISIGADLSQVFVTVKYSDGSTNQVPLSELVVTGLDTSTEGVVDGVVLDYGGFKQTISFNVVPTELQVEYVASTGGRIEGETLQKVTAGADATRIEAIADEGYYFAGWSDGNVNASRLDTQVSKSMRLIAVFEKLRYTVVFYYPDGTTAREEEVAYNEAPLSVPTANETNMELYGYRFVGWDTDFKHITKDTNVHPIYEKYATDFHVEFTTDKSGRPLGSIKDLKSYYEKDEEANVRITANPDRKFIGWSIFNVDLQAWINLDPVMTESKLIAVNTNSPISFISTRTGTTEEFVLSFTPDENIDEILVKAHFVYLESEISFTSMNNQAHDSFLISYDTPIGEKFDVEDLTYLSTLGYAFKGWYVSGGEANADGTPVLVNNQTTFSQPTELIAYWEKEIFTAVFLKGGNEDPSFIDVNAGYNEELGGRVVTAYYQDSLAGALTGAFPEVAPYKANYTFKGWYLADADRLPTSKVIDKTFKLEAPVSYFVPVFEVNTKNLTVVINGSGSIYSLDYDAQYGVDVEKGISGIVAMPVNEQYRIRIRPSAGYVLSSVDVNGATSSGANLAVDGYYDVSIGRAVDGGYLIETDYVITATFKLTSYVVSVANGTQFTTSGHLTYNVLGGDDTLKNETDALTPAIEVNYGSGLSLEIVPQKGYYISQISLNGEALSVPDEAVYYNLVLENVTTTNAIVINYEKFVYVVDLPNATEEGSFTADIEMGGKYSEGDSASFTALANEGYYVRRITANGTIIDPYIAVNGYAVSGVEVNGKAVSVGDATDYRVTKMVITINGVSQDVDFAIEYAPLYYNVTTSYEGIGSVTAPFTIGYNKPFHVKAETNAGYYVYSVIVNGVETTFADAQLAREFSDTSAKEDYDVKFIFKKTAYYVRFFDADGNSAVTINDVNVKLASGVGYTKDNVEHASTQEFLITANEGYFINSITVSPVGGLAYSEIVNYYAQSHLVTLTNVSTSYAIEIECVAITYDYDLYFINKGSNSIKVNNQNLSGTYSATIAHGNDLTMEFDLARNNSVLIENVVIKNKDQREAYYYQPLLGEYVSSPTNGFYALIADKGQSSKLSLNVYDVKTAIEVYVTFTTQESGNNLFNMSASGNGTLTATDTALNPITSGTSLVAGVKVILTATPEEGHSLRNLIVNGQEVEVEANTYSFLVEGDTTVYAVFSETEYTVSVQGGIMNGVVATDRAMVQANTSFNVKLTPVEGYKIETFAISVEGSDVTYQPLNSMSYEGGALDYAVPQSQVTGNVTIVATFAPLQYLLTYSRNEFGTLGGVGDAGEVDVFYGETKEVELSAVNGYYISEILLNGESISPQTLIGTPIVSGEYVSGILQIYVTSDVDLKVTFSPMVYTIIVNESLGGTTLVKKDNSAYLPASEIKLSAGNVLSIKMSAHEGYHIEELRVNGLVDNGWKEGNISQNDQNEIYYKLGEVTGNVTLRVIYAINEYQIQVNVSNQSPNFSAVDVDSQNYGTVTITGYNPGENNLYTGFTHGSNVKFVVTPRTARGYYVAKFELQYFDEDGLPISNVVSSFNENGGSYILYGISYDIQAVNVVFKRRAYAYEGFKTIENLGSSWMSTGDIVATFTNPYSSQPVVVENGLYEYGLNFTINVNPGTGYSRTQFTINGEDRLESVRNNNYVGTVTGSMSVDVVYTINTYNVNMLGSLGGTYAVYSLDNQLLWKPQMEIVSEDYFEEENGDKIYYVKSVLATGTVWATSEGLIATYGTELNFSATPDSDSGYKTNGFYVNKRANAISNENAEMRVRESIKSEVDVEISFTIHTYNITVNTFEGGVATLSTSLVEWHDSVTIRLVITRGYVMDAVLVNGTPNADATDALENRGVYTVYSIVEDVAFEIRLVNKQYDVTFSGDYNKEYEIRQEGVVAKNLSAVSGVIVNQGSLIKEEKAFYTSDSPVSFDINGKLINVETDENNQSINLNRTVFADKLTIVLKAPDGYRITAVSITMDNDGGVVSNLVLSESGLDADDGSGTRTYTIPSMKGNVKVHVEYAIKTYEVEYVQRVGGSYVSTGTTLVSHHELFTVDMVSDEGFFLSNLVINGRTIATVNTKDGMRYRYTTDVQGLNGITRLEINDELVNGENKITVMPTYDKQRYSVIFYVNNLQITNFYQDATLGVTLENNEVIYDATIPSIVAHELQAGYSITSIIFYSVPINDATAINNKYEFSLEGSTGRNYNVFTKKGETLEITLDEGLLNILDYHSNNKNVLRIYYRTEKDVHTSKSSMYLVEGDGAFNVGKSVTANEVPKVYNRPAFASSASFSDFKTSDSHEYNTEATYTVRIDVNAINTYSFQGYQEKIDGEWSYVVNGVNGITLQSNGQVLRYTMTSDREFRAVFFRTYEITVQIHPEYKYTEGSFATSEPERMKYRQYASLTATATYQERGSGVILPNVASTQEILEDVDGVDDASYTYRVLSGARLVLRGNDGISVNSTKGYSYSVITYNGNKLVQTEDSYTLGVETLEDRLVYAYFNNVMYVSFAMETVGSTTSGAGGRVSYAVNGATVNNLTNNSITMTPNQTLTITITPNSSYRFDSVMELLPLSEPDSQGFRQFSSTFTPLRATEDGTVEITYYNENGAVITNTSGARISRAVVTIHGINENSIFKIRFWKQVKVSKSISLITDEMNGQDGGPEYEIAYTGNSSNTTSVNGITNNDYAVYDYNDELFFNLMFDLSEDEFNGLKRYYQFVGYFINGVNAYTQLVQNYPSTYEGRFIINDLDGLSNGVIIEENNYVQSGISYTDFVVKVVARFVPVYNVVIENEYLDSGNYLDPGPITATTIMYDENLTQYYKTSQSVEPKLGQEDTYNTDIHFQMLGKINSANATDKGSSSSPYNVWGDNMLSLNWAGANGTGDNFAFIAWQYYAYTGSGFEWRNIPYVDPNSQTNLVTKPDFTFPISSLFSTSYTAYLSDTGVVGEAGFSYDASLYDAVGDFAGTESMYAIRIRPLFQKVESLDLVKSTALNDASIFLDGKGDVDPKIGSVSRSSGNFNYYTVQTLLPAAPSGYEFAGWYITENGQGGQQPLLLQATESDNNGTPVVQGENTYYFKTEVIKDLQGNPTDRKITYSYNPVNGQMQLLMDDSFKIYARYIRIYTIRIKVTNLSGISPALQESMPTINYYKKVDGAWVLQGELSDERLIEINDARVGTQLRFTLSTNYKHDVNDSTYFNPLFDRFVNVTSVNENNLNVWDQNGSLDAQNSTIPTLLRSGLQGRDLDSMSAYNDAVLGMELLISANAEKTINVNFESFGVLNLHNVYVGSAIKLPDALGEALYKQDNESVELGSDVMGNDAYFVKDNGVGDSNVNSGIISIVDVPITNTVSFDGEDKGDYATRLLDGSNVLESDSISIGINYDGSSLTKKVQNVVYYSTKTYVEYVWEEGVLEEKESTGTSLYDYPFADGGNATLAGNGTEAKPFRIASVNHLRNVDSLYKGNNGTLVYGTEGGQSLRIHFIQVQDVNLTETNNSFETPIASAFTADNGVTYTNGFNGIYDGDGYTLYNLQLTNTSFFENVGIFAKIYRGGVVKNVNIGNSYVYSRANNVGILAGQVFGGTVSNVNTVVKGSENVQSTVTGSNFVGGLVGLLAGESDQEGLVTGCSISGYTVSASMGGSYLGVGGDFTGGAGGLVGSIARGGRVYGSDSYSTNASYYTTSSVTVQTGTSYGAEGIGAGGIVGTVQFNSSDDWTAVENVVAVNAGLAASNNNVAIGGIVGAVGANNVVQNAIHKVTAPMTIRSKSAVEGFTAPNSSADRGNFYLYGGGGIAGYNNGYINNVEVRTESTFRLNINGSMVGGIVGVNFGTVNAAKVQARILTTRQKSTSYEGGTYGGMIGFNVGSITNSTIQGAQSATNDYNSTTAAYEVITGSEAYVPTSGANGGMHGDAGKDTTSIYIGGVVGYNEGTITNVTNNSKLMFNKRSNDEVTNYSYVGAIAGSSTTDTITANGNAIIKYFHYVWVDPKSGDDVENQMVAYIGNGSGNKSIGGCNVTATAEFVGGGSIFTPASDEVKWGDVSASGYLKGSASVYFYSINSSSAYSYVSRDWNEEGAISAAQGETGKAYANTTDCYYTKADISIWGAWNYYGTLRFVAVSAGNY